MEEKQGEQDASGNKKKKKSKNKSKTISIDEFQHGPAQVEEKGIVLQYVFLDGKGCGRASYITHINKVKLLMEKFVVARLLDIIEVRWLVVPPNILNHIRWSLSFKLGLTHVFLALASPTCYTTHFYVRCPLVEY